MNHNGARIAMTTPYYVPLAHRSLIALGGTEPKTFLQGLVSCDVKKVTPDCVIYGAFLTPQGKFLHDFFLGEKDDTLFLETEAEGREEFIRRLQKYNLRKKVSLTPVEGVSVYAAFGDGVAQSFPLPAVTGAAIGFSGGTLFADPRLPNAGVRAWLSADQESSLPAAGAALTSLVEWDRQRISLGLPDGSRDMPQEGTILLENGFDELGGVDWKKGCFLGQEVTARSKYRGHVKKRLMPVAISGPAPAAGTPIFLEEAEVGEMRSHVEDVGLALIRIETFEQITGDGRALRAGESLLTPRKPDWAVF
jgi:folate-binding protein YgfZ